MWGAWRGFGLGVPVLCVLLRAYQIKRLCVNFAGGGKTFLRVLCQREQNCCQSLRGQHLHQREREINSDMHSPTSSSANIFFSQDLPENAKLSEERKPVREKRAEDAKNAMNHSVQSQSVFSTAIDLREKVQSPQPPAYPPQDIRPPDARQQAPESNRRPNSRHQRFKRPGHRSESKNVTDSVPHAIETTSQIATTVRSVRSPIRSNFCAEQLLSPP
jgi:hypothetical protein